ncbi:MAG: PKD domain-containing protein [Candidatus Pacebacteria bacterium]|nr:PKD domain-containing protein [Candidatus Paceibacterota bacterium]
MSINNIANNNKDRWIEVFNNGDDIADFTASSYKIVDSKDTTKHGINTLLGDKLFLSNTNVFISPSTSTPVGVEKVFRSPYDLDKDNGYILIVNSDGSVIYACKSYGNAVCPNENTNSTTSEDTYTPSDSTSTTAEETVYVYVPVNNQEKYGDIQVLLPEEKVVPALAETEYTVKVTDSQKRLVTDLDFHWSFGDGGEDVGKDVYYTYIYPGEYTLIASADGFTGGAKARMTVKVIVPEISISEIGSENKNNFITFKNNTEFDLFLSNFYLDLDGKLYKLPKNLMIAKNKSVKLSGEALGFKLPANNISLLYPNKNVLTTFEKINTLSSSTIMVATNSKLNSSVQELENVISEKNIENTSSKKVVGNNQNLSTEKQEISSLNEKTEPIYLKRLVWDSQEKDLELFKNQSKSEVSQKEFGGVDTRIVDWIKNLIY